MTIKKYPNHEKVIIPVKVIKKSEGPNRHARRADIAFKRQTPGRVKKQNIRDAHDKIMQRAVAKINNLKK